MKTPGQYFIDEDEHLCVLIYCIQRGYSSIVLATPHGKTNSEFVYGREWEEGYYEIIKTVEPSEFELFDDHTFKLK